MADMIHLQCPACAAPLEAPEGREQFYCRFCGTSVVVPREDHDDDRDREVAKPRGPVVIPEKLVVHDYGSELTISWRWFTPAGLLLLPFCIAWNAFLVGWYSLALSSDGPPGGFAIIMLLFPMVHVAVGLGLLYACAVLLCNSTKVRVRDHQLTVAHGPIPAGKTQVVEVHEIDQLYVKQELKKARSSNNPLSHTLYCRTKAGREITLLGNNDDANIARAVEHLVEKHLGIEDKPV
jgi:hypothetical protein